ncbi:hypothetical protein K2173_012160 [Erythroxylum novogranatense]|uniref:Syntaxin 6/10/61 N-terminal domain-containing protein n=1 Tax=Erythroxylum novogranatense TaxID=1862640 RepID=A0AAV8SS00_9ROSI|nr:hypothetical protein K2173_012160 [Erythroxylum novogranatense]
MASSLHQWESDPLFSAAEVVQDSADRMESVFRLLEHEQSLVHGDHPDPRLLTSIEYHKRDLATILETAKWQLEDFERAVCLSTVDKSRASEDVISRHRQFIRAIKEHITHVEESMQDQSMVDFTRNFARIDLSERDRDLLQLFLTGEDKFKHINHHDFEDSNMLRRFLDPTSASCLKDEESVEHDSREFEVEKMNGHAHTDDDHNCIMRDNLRKGSHYSTRLGRDVVDSLQHFSCNRNGDDDHFDVEANEAARKSFTNENNTSRLWNRINLHGSFSNSWKNRAIRSYTKRLKDGEEQRRDSSTYFPQGQHIGLWFSSGNGSIRGLLSRFTAKVMHCCVQLGARYQRRPCHIQFNRHSARIICITVLTLLCLGILVSKIA